MQLNNKQKNGIFIGVAMILLLLTLHNPTSGYITKVPMPVPSGMTALSAAYWQNRGCDESSSNGDYVCENGKEYSKIPFSEWESKKAIISDLASISKTLSITLAIIIGTLLWVYLNREPQHS